MHKHKESDTRKRNELPNEAAGVWNESRFQNGGRRRNSQVFRGFISGSSHFTKRWISEASCNFIGACARYFLTLYPRFSSYHARLCLFLRFLRSVVDSSPVRGQLFEVKTCTVESILSFNFKRPCLKIQLNNIYLLVPTPTASTTSSQQSFF